MKSTFKGLFVLVVLALPFLAVLHDRHVTGQAFGSAREEEEENGIPLRDRIDLAWEQERDWTYDLSTGDVPRERLAAAYTYMRQLQQQQAVQKAAGAITGVNWTERGPNNVAGRTRSIMVDPNDGTKKTVWVGSVGGGIWKTTDITASSPTWTPVNDLFANIAVSCIVYDPSNTQVFYFSTGEGWSNSDAQRGLGIWKTSDGGSTWSQLASTNNSNFYWIQRLAVASNGDLYAATKTGLRKSTDGAASFTKVLGSGTGSSSNNISDVEIAADGAVWAGVGIWSTDGVYRSTTGNAGSWTKLNTGGNGFPTSGIRRIELAVAPSNASVCYALVQGSGNGLGDIYKTTNTGSSWSTLAKPNDADGGIPANDFTRSQAWYDFSLAVDPNNANTVFAGGVDLFKSTNGGSSWSQIAHWYGGYGYQYVHADQHIAYFEPGNSSVIYFGNDGGIWRSANATSGTPSIAFKGDNYNVTQFYACAMNPTAYSNEFLAGAQDNGSHAFSTAGIGSTVEVTGGDGMFCHIDQGNPSYMFTSYVYSNYFRSSNGGASFSTITSNNNGYFVNPSDYDNVNQNFYASYTNGTYSRILNARTSTSLTNVSIGAFGTGRVTHVSCSPNTANRVFFGLNNGLVVRVDNANTGSPSATDITGGSMPGGTVTCIAVETGNDNHLLVTYGNYGANSVWETTNGGSTWTSVEGNLPDMPVRWALFNPNDPGQALLATELGVWSTDLLNGGTTTWGPSNSGLANTRVDMLQIRSSDNIVAAATHGRGLFTSDVFASPFPDFVADRKIVYINKPVQFTDASYKSTAWSWNFGDGTNASTANPVKTYATAGTYTVTLEINNNAAYTETKTAYVQVLPNRGTPYAPAAGGNFETSTGDFGADNATGTPWQRGNSSVNGKNGVNSGSNAWVTGLTGSYVNNTDARLMTPNYNFSMPGTYTLRFYRKNSFEINWDGFRVEYSLDKGDSWTALGVVTANWYDFSNSTQTTAFPINEPFFNATRSSFTLASYDVSSLAGNANVAFRIRFRSDAAVTGTGVAIDDFEIIGPSNDPLPVRLLSFSGTWEADGNRLEWQTASELINAGFDIERSVDAERFEKIGFVTGAGTTTTLTAYSFLDDGRPAPLCYYRLKQIDYNGDFSYSKTIAVRGERDGVQYVFPNPFTDRINIVVDGEAPALRVRLYDLAGKKVLDRTMPSDGYMISLDIGDELPAEGSYLLVTGSDDSTVARKVFRKR